MMPGLNRRNYLFPLLPPIEELTCDRDCALFVYKVRHSVLLTLRIWIYRTRSAFYFPDKDVLLISYICHNIVHEITVFL